MANSLPKQPARPSPAALGAAAVPAADNAAAVDPNWYGDALPSITPTKSQARVIDILARNPRQAAYSEVAEIAEQAHVDTSTVVRTAQALGYQGWRDLQRELRARYLVRASNEDSLIEHGLARNPLYASITRDMDNLRFTAEANTPEDMSATTTTLAEASSIRVFALGSYAGPAVVMAHLGSTLGFPIRQEVNAGPALATAANTFGPGDVIVLINLWRSIAQLRVVAEAAHTAGATLVAITDQRRGWLAELADHLLIVPSDGISFFQSVTAANSLVYALLAGMVDADPDRARTAIRNTQKLWSDMGIYLD